MTYRKNLIYTMTALVAFALCGIPEAVQAQEPAQQPTQQAPQNQQQQPANPGLNVDPSQGPLVPPAANEQQPPSNAQEETIYPDHPTPQTTAVQQQQQAPREPLGAATAGTVKTTGGGASRPAGNAIAPAKQHQVRSFLIKFGAIAAAGIAVGTVYALSKGTPSTPPNSGR